MSDCRTPSTTLSESPSFAITRCARRLVLFAYSYAQQAQVDLYRDCPFWQEDSFCGNRACAVDWADEVRTRERYQEGTSHR
jgi:hypothetical protein